ncbi:nitroreductase [Marinobacter sp. HN1S83]|uniref:nitroreductase family protein n=1 Tax=Marinobacter sp. HN1S83 TaxID=3382301 RepID=UPI00387B7FC6
MPLTRDNDHCPDSGQADMGAIEALMTRRSYVRSLLRHPAPTTGELETILQAAISAPDHGNLRPWRFVVVRGEAMTDLARLVRELYAGRDMSADDLQAFVDEIAATPMMLFVCAEVVAGHRVPDQEQQMSAAAACQQMLVAIHALGYGAIWHSVERHPAVWERLGLAEKDSIVGVLSVGTPDPRKNRPRKRRSFTDFTWEWHAGGDLRPWRAVDLP